MNIAIIGAGLSGATASYILKKYDDNININIYEKSKNIGGNCADEYNDFCYKQLFGPHIFHTNKKYIWNFLNLFGEFNTYQHKVLSYIDGDYVNFPLSKDYIKENYFNRIDSIYSSESIIADNAQEYLYKKLGEDLTNKFFTNYSEKQWGMSLDKLPVEVVQRIPIRNNNDTRYFTDKYQGIPQKGYSKLINKIIKDIRIINKKVTYNDIKDEYDLIINTGEVDDFFNNKFGVLQYRSILFRFMYNLFDQKTAVVNYPNEYDFTRITNFNLFIYNNDYSLFGLEYPCHQDYQGSIKCYPIYWLEENKVKYEQYKNYAKQNNVILLGRMGKYQYFNMDAAIHDVFDTLTQFNSNKLKEELNDLIF